MLRDYQKKAHDAAINWIRRETQPGLIDMPTASGKSWVISAIAHTLHKMSGKSILCTAPNKELVEQNYEKYLLTGDKASMFSASAGQISLRHPVVFGSPMTIKNRLRRFDGKFCAVIIDECFTGDTLVLTPKGYKRIDQIEKGEKVNNALGVGEVMRVFKNISKDVMQVRFNNGTIIECTRGHPIFTENGFIKAEKLEAGTRVFSSEELRLLRECFQTKIYEVRKRKNCCKRIGVTLEEARILFKLLLEEKEQSHDEERIKREDEEKIERIEAQANDAWRERKTSKYATISFMPCSWGWVGNGMFSKNESWTFKWRISKLLQIRYWKQKFNDWYRNRRTFPFNYRKKNERQKKGRFPGIIRVESLQDNEQLCDRVVYNLCVSGHPSYFAGGILVHNCHEITPTIKKIVDHIKSHNEFCRVIGTTATPYRLGSGYIFERDYDNRIVQEAIEPYFKKRIIKVDPYELTALGFLSPYTFVETAEHYDTSGLELNRQGKWINEDKAYSGQCRKTSNIIAEIVEKSRYRKGVIIFAATVRHAKECMASLPPGISAIVTGETGRLERDQIIRDFKSQKIKYFVNVGVATRGFDAPHVDVIALLRLTESKALLQQMIGRGMRTDDNKENFLILDYALNVGRHCNNNDIFDVDVEIKEKSTAPQIQAICPYCGNDNYFSQVVNDKGYLVDKNGYFTDLEGNRIRTAYGPLPAHYGRRCSFHDEITDKRCGYRWTSKPCHECETDNDVTARYCSKCDYEFVDPNKNLTFDKIKDHSDDEIIDVHSIAVKDVTTKKGMPAKRVEIVSMAGRIYYIWFMHEHKYLKYAYFEFLNAYKKGVGRVTLNKKNGFYRIKKYDLSEVVEGVR